MRRGAAGLMVVLATAWGLAGDASKPPSTDAIRASLKLPAGLRVELVACEPQISSPVHIAFAPDGQLWVVEMRDYPNGPGPGEAPGGRIRRLEDRDGDGFFETSTVFAEGLLFANGLLPWKDGLVVTAAPHILHVRDVDGDGKADRRDVLYEGFAAQNPQLRVSHPILGIDGWITVANGLRGGQIVKAGGKSAPIELRGMDFRFDLVHDRAEAVTGLGQFGNTFDDWGARFVCDNRQHLRHIAIENKYLKNNPAVAAPTAVQDVSVLTGGPLSSGGKIFPLSKNWTTSSLHEGRFTAACGVHLFRGAGLPDEYRDNAYTCDPTGNLVHRERLTPRGASFVAEPPTPGVEFLASPNDWFRPVSLASGPDGALYVVDMCRAVIEHPEFMPAELKKRPDLVWGKDAGRIWRIVPDGPRAKAPAVALDKRTSRELVGLLSHANEWHRSTAHRLLLERQDADVVDDLRKAVRSGTPQAKVLAAGLLDSMVYLDNATLVAMQSDASPRVREWGVRLSESRLAKTVLLQVAARTRAKDPDARVRYQAALTLSLAPQERNIESLRTILLAGADDPWTRLAVRLSLRPGDAADQRMGSAARFVAQLLASPELRKLDAKVRRALIEEFAAVAGQEAVGGDVLLAAQGMDGADQRALLLGLASGLQTRRLSLESYFARALPRADDPAGVWLRGFLETSALLASDASAGPDDRLAAVRLMAYASWPRAEKPLAALIASEPNHDLRLAAVRALASHSQPETAKLLLDPWRSYSPGLRREATDALFRSEDRQLALLRAVEAGQVKPADLDALRTRQLLGHKLPAVRILADKLLKANVPGDRQEALKKYRAALDLKGDPARGKATFQKHCAICHRVGGVGVDVGPDIADTRTKTLEGLLVDIVVPNQAIDANFVQYLATTKAGKTVAGLLVSETATSVTFKRAEAQVETLLRSEIEEIASTGVSLMPDGLERNLTIPEMADLLAFLKNWRYLDGATPLGK